MLVTDDQDAAEVSCDRCGAVFRLAGVEPEALWARAQADGWQAERLGGVWWHRCPSCAHRFS
ncbi:hypothetical protein [Dactylosporangium sp. CA-139066]|uniref:hypothetical protein n=1 Tax=Dactylosporangium sp. CA-139066 TaxID=3239930 RepID=UPI003D8E888A